jgi:hypothetical protein
MSIVSGQSYVSEKSGGDIGGPSSVLSRSSAQTTQSPSRSRRPGAARKRLAKAKEAEKHSTVRKTGWQESMQAAAASAERIWQPKVGWVGYSDQQGNETYRDATTSFDTEKIHIPLHVFAKNKKNKSGATKVAEEAHSDLSFPVNWGTGNQISQNLQPTANSGMQPRVEPKPKTVAVHSVVGKNHPTPVKQSQPQFPKTKQPMPLRTESGDSCWPQQRVKHNKLGNHVVNYSKQSSAFGSPGEERDLKLHLRQPTNKTGGKNLFVVSPPRPHRSNGVSSPIREAKSKHLKRATKIVEHITSPNRLHQKEQTNTVPPQRRAHSLSPIRSQQAEEVAQKQKQGNRSDSSFEISRPSDSPSRSRGWVESMRDATASLAKDGHRWDPKHGFSNLDARSVSDVITISSNDNNTPLVPGKRQEALQNTSKLSPADILEEMLAERRKNDPPGRKPAVGSQQLSKAVPLSTPVMQHSDFVERPCASGNEDLDNGIAPADQSTVKHERIDVTPDGVMVGHGTPVRSRNDCGIAVLNYEENLDYLIEPSAPIVVTPNVHVRKERVGREDVNWFSHSQRKIGQNRSVGASPVSPVKDDTKISDLARRRAGPVDVDEVETMSSSDCSQDSNVWKDGKFEKDSFFSGSISSPNMPSKRNSSAKTISPFIVPSTIPHVREKKGISWSAQAKKLTQTVRRNLEQEKRPENNAESLRGKIQNGGAESNPSSFAAEDASQLSSASSVTAGWKTFMQKKLQAESLVATKQQQQNYQTKEESGSKEEKIKKSVSFASDSLLSDSLLADSLFDFSASDGETPSSPSRGAYSRQPNSRVPDSFPDRDNTHSLGKPTDMAPIAEEAAIRSVVSAENEIESPWLLKRLASSVLPTHRNQSGDGRGMDKDRNESPVACNLYLQTKQASEKFEAMMAFLRDRKPISSCTNSKRDDETKRSQIARSISEQEKDEDRAAEELARARVEALVKSLYYGGLDDWDIPTVAETPTYTQ